MKIKSYLIAHKKECAMLLFLLSLLNLASIIGGCESDGIGLMESVLASIPLLIIMRASVIYGKLWELDVGCDEMVSEEVEEEMPEPVRLTEWREKIIQGIALLRDKWKSLRS